MKLAQRILVSTALALPLTLGVATPSFAEATDAPIVEVQQCPRGYEGVIVIVYIQGQPNGIVVCQNILP